MKVGIYHGKNEGLRSIKLLADGFAGAWPESVLAGKVADLKHCDVVLNLVIEDMTRIEEARRFIGYGKQVCFFTSNVEEVGAYKPTLIGLLSSLEKIPMIVHSEYHYMGVQKATAVFNPAHQRKLLSNLHLIYGGIEQIFRYSNKNSKQLWMVPYNRINNGQKDVRLHAQINTRIQAYLGVKGIEIPEHRYYLLPHEYDAEKQKEYKLDGYHFSPCPDTRKEYVANLKQTGIFYSTSKFESFGLMYLEMLLCGGVGVFLRKPWIEWLLPDYKLMTDKANLDDMIIATYNDYDKAKAYIKKDVLPFIRKRYGIVRFYNEVYQLLESRLED